MTIPDSYAGLARLLEYPDGKETVLAAHDTVARFLRESGLECPTSPFAEFVAGSSLAEIQEDYVATFDFNPAAAPYLGHHLYGDHRKKGEYMIRVKREFGRHGFTPAGNELPDHLGVLLSFLAHLASRGDDAARRQFITSHVLPGLEKLAASFAARRESPWKALVDAAEVLCTADCKEVQPCWTA